MANQGRFGIVKRVYSPSYSLADGDDDMDGGRTTRTLYEGRFTVLRPRGS